MAGDPRTAPDTGDPAKLDVLRVSPNFLVVSKVPDLVINDDDPERPSLYNQVRANFPHLADDKVKVLHQSSHSCVASE